MPWGLWIWPLPPPQARAVASNWLMPCEVPSVGKRISLADYTRLKLIVPRLIESDPAGIIKELSQRLGTQNVIGDVLSFYHAAFNHDLLNNSALPTGIALPHARSSQVARLTLAIGRTREAVFWGTKNSWLVDHVFLIAVPATNALEYLALLSCLTGFGSHAEMLAGLRAAADDRDIFNQLQKIIVWQTNDQHPNKRITTSVNV